MRIKTRFMGQGKSYSLVIAIAVVLTLGTFTTVRAYQDRDNNGRNNGDGERFAIGLWGDLPYSDVQAQVGVPNFIADMNSQELRSRCMTAT
jgi:hypothetical protein